MLSASIKWWHLQAYEESLRVTIQEQKTGKYLRISHSLFVKVNDKNVVKAYSTIAREMMCNSCATVMELLHGYIWRVREAKFNSVEFRFSYPLNISISKRMGPSLVQVMACFMFSTKPLPVPLLTGSWTLKKNVCEIETFSFKKKEALPNKNHCWLIVKWTLRNKPQ